MASFEDVGVDGFWLWIVFPFDKPADLAANGEVAWWTRSLFKSGSTSRSRCDIFLLRWICTLLGSKWKFSAQGCMTYKVNRRGEPGLKRKHGEMCERWNITRGEIPKILIELLHWRCLCSVFWRFLYLCISFHPCIDFALSQFSYKFRGARIDVLGFGMFNARIGPLGSRNTLFTPSSNLVTTAASEILTSTIDKRWLRQTGRSWMVVGCGGGRTASLGR